MLYGSIVPPRCWLQTRVELPPALQPQSLEILPCYRNVVVNVEDDDTDCGFSFQGEHTCSKPIFETKRRHIPEDFIVISAGI
jgi:hypothetical protein